MLKHLILPASSVIISSIFISIYNWRTFFLIYSSEDYVEMAKAKGLLQRDIERRYILQPTLPTIITNFALLLITLWTGFRSSNRVSVASLGITSLRRLAFMTFGRLLVQQLFTQFPSGHYRLPVRLRLCAVDPRVKSALVELDNDRL